MKNYLFAFALLFFISSRTTGQTMTVINNSPDVINVFFYGHDAATACGYYYAYASYAVSTTTGPFAANTLSWSALPDYTTFVWDYVLVLYCSAAYGEVGAYNPPHCPYANAVKLTDCSSNYIGLSWQDDGSGDITVYTVVVP